MPPMTGHLSLKAHNSVNSRDLDTQELRGTIDGLYRKEQCYMPSTDVEA